MSERTQWITHKGKRMLYADFAGIRDEETYISAFDELEAEILRQPAGQMTPLLLNVSNTVLTPTIRERSQRMMTAAREHGIPDSPTAMVGLSGAQRAVVQLMQFFRRDLQIADTVEEAKEWLVKQLGG